MPFFLRSVPYLFLSASGYLPSPPAFQEDFPLRLPEVRLDHGLYQFPERHLRLPAEFLPGLCCVSQKEVHFRGTEISPVYFYDRFTGLGVDSLFISFRPRPFYSYARLFESE